MKINKMSHGDYVFEIVNIILISLLGFVCLYPIIYVFSSSISNTEAVMRGDVWLFPVGFSISSYERIFKTASIWNYYYNSIWYTVVGTLFNVIATILLAYPLSKSYFVLRKQLTFLVIFTMFFSGGLIPTFLLVSDIGLYGTRWVMVFIGLINTYNMILARTFFHSLPEELFENARIEGATELRIIKDIAIPLSKPIIAVLVLYYGVAHWNTYLNALIYLPKVELQPIQVLLRRVVLQNSMDMMEYTEIDPDAEIISNQIKYAVIFFSMAPILCLYPFLQKHFVKGVMIGALKG